jgi:hypothetical protein
VTLSGKAVPLGKGAYKFFDFGFFGYCNHFAAAQTADVVVMMGKNVTEFDFVFPANVDSLY